MFWTVIEEATSGCAVAATSDRRAPLFSLRTTGKAARLAFFTVSMLAVVCTAPHVLAADWFKALTAKHNAPVADYATLMASSCTGGSPRKITVLADLADEEKIGAPVIYPQVGHYAAGIAVSPGGKYLFSYDANMGGRLWEAGSGRLVWSKRIDLAGIGFIEDVTFSPDGSRLYFVQQSHNAIQVIDPVTGDPAGEISIGPTNVPGAFTEDGAAVTGWSITGDDKSGLYRLPSGERIAETQGRIVAMSPPGTVVLTMEANTCRVWDACRGKPKKHFELAGEFRQAAFSPDGKRLAIMDSSGLAVYDTRKKRPLWESPKDSGHRCSSRGMQFSADGRFLYLIGSCPSLHPSSPTDTPLLVIDAENGQVAKVLASGVSFGALSRTPDGAFTLAGMKKKILFVDESRLDIVQVIGGDMHSGEFTVAADGRLLTPYRLWSPETGMPDARLPIPRERIENHSTQVVMAAGENVLITLERLIEARTCRITWWDGTSGRELRTLDVPVAPQMGLLSCRMSEDARVLAVAEPHGAAHRVRLVDLETGTQIKEIVPPTGESFAINLVKLSANGERVAVSMNHRVGVWRVRGEDESLVTDVDSPVGFALSPDGDKLLLRTHDTSGNAGLEVVDLVSGSRVFHKTPGLADEDIVIGLVFSPDGAHAAISTAKGRFFLWSEASGALREWRNPQKVAIGLVRFSPDGARAYSTCGFGGLGIQVWDVASGQELARLMEFGDGEWLSMTPDGYYASSENGDRQLNVRVGLRVQGIGQYFETFYRPDLVAKNLRPGKPSATPAGPPRKSLLGVAAQGAPPSVVFESPATETVFDQRDVEVVAGITDHGGGVGRIEWKPVSVARKLLGAPEAVSNRSLTIAKGPVQAGRR